jgi:hypothetical protein
VFLAKDPLLDPLYVNGLRAGRKIKWQSSGQKAQDSGSRLLAN